MGTPQTSGWNPHRSTLRGPGRCPSTASATTSGRRSASTSSSRPVWMPTTALGGGVPPRLRTLDLGRIEVDNFGRRSDASTALVEVSKRGQRVWSTPFEHTHVGGGLHIWNPRRSSSATTRPSSWSPPSSAPASMPTRSRPRSSRAAGRRCKSTSFPRARAREAAGPARPRGERPVVLRRCEARGPRDRGTSSPEDASPLP